MFVSCGVDTPFDFTQGRPCPLLSTLIFAPGYDAPAPLFLAGPTCCRTNCCTAFASSGCEK
jgi:hypothetical protein